MSLRTHKSRCQGQQSYIFRSSEYKETANVGMAHSNQRNFLEHSEEPYNKYRYLHLIPNLQLTSAARTGTANGPQIALGPHFAQVCPRASTRRRWQGTLPLNRKKP